MQEVRVPEYDMSVCAPAPVDKWKPTVLAKGGVIVMEVRPCVARACLIGTDQMGHFRTSCRSSSSAELAS